jgi:hypothetical protein
MLAFGEEQAGQCCWLLGTRELAFAPIGLPWNTVYFLAMPLFIFIKLYCLLRKSERTQRAIWATTTAAINARVSTKDKGQTNKNQLRERRAFAARLGYTS